jgi:hypothetical protein
VAPLIPSPGRDDAPDSQRPGGVSLLLAASAAVLWVISYPRYRPNFVDLSWNVGHSGVDSESGRIILWVNNRREGWLPRPVQLRWQVLGVSYRSSDGPDGWALLTVPHAMVLAALLVLPVVVLHRERGLRARRRRAAAGLCPLCGYDLRASPGPCPECGAGPEAPARALLPPRRLFHRLPRRAQKLFRCAVWRRRRPPRCCWRCRRNGPAVRVTRPGNPTPRRAFHAR